MKQIFQTEIDGHKYEVEWNPALKHEPMFRSCLIFRLRKDGTRGKALLSTRKAYTKAWLSVRKQFKD